MGICISSASSEIHGSEAQDDHENVTVFEGSVDPLGAKRLGSVYSKQGSKGLNQDAAVLYEGYGEEDGAFCGVFDGHGKNGHVVSKIVRNCLPSLLLSQQHALEKTRIADDPDTRIQSRNTESQFAVNKWREACISAFRVMDKEIKLQENLDFSCSGTTAVVVLRQGEDLVIANLGDSRAVLGTITENGIRAVQLTRDLKPGIPSEAERIRKCNGRVIALKEEPHIQRVWLPHEDTPGLAMSRAFGDFLLKDYGVIAIPDINHRQLNSNDQFVVIATDGVWDVLSNNQVASMVWAAESEETAAKAVVDAAVAAWKNRFPSSKVDDCTAVCLFLKNKKQ
ncbi:protein phosphatase 2C 72 [Tripterygium wilfordii]|uniref:Protein phosphatase 2C 72 n=1 Tax=Tripterygium wilfordii TaxID=458696 RepID=A0A7J7DPM8_TRIWF|nr:probable protein phosphatase 2C 72 [Tripterygium wilfordii]KAF5748301.1 protein phosphatase 2C 72 [Tripterygium wilfordii]